MDEWGFFGPTAIYIPDKFRAFPASLTLIGFFVGYELYRLTETRSLILLFFISVDAGIWWLIKDEWWKTRRRLGL